MSSVVLAESSTRLRATVTSSVPDALAEAAISEEEENFPVPRNRREENVLSAIVNIVLRFTENRVIRIRDVILRIMRFFDKLLVSRLCS